MIQFEKHTLKNGLRVIVHPDISTPLAAVNVIYNVGSKDENPEKTGFAHLFEHLMFGGSKNIPDYDSPLQRIGGESNAFTTNDITNYYQTLPAENIETGFWLESDRMLELSFSKKGLEVQRNVVIEEFRQRYLNQPYGDTQALIHELAYKVHPYRWPTIGKEISHIENAILADVKDFFFKHYPPNNAVLVVSGNVKTDQVFKLAEKWFGEIPARNVPGKNIPVEPVQTAFRALKVERDVSFDAIYIAFHTDRKLTSEYYTTDLISDILSNGHSSRLYRRLVVEKGLFGELDAYISGDDDPGLISISGKLIPSVSLDQAEKAIWDELERFKHERVEDIELQKVINKVEANLIFSEISFLNKAMSLASFELLGDASLINCQTEMYRQVTPQKLNEVANKLFRRENCSTLYYQKKHHA
jgi:zinc protease